MGLFLLGGCGWGNKGMCLLDCQRLPLTLVDPCVAAGLLAEEEAAFSWCGLISHPSQLSPRPSLTRPGWALQGSADRFTT